MTQVESLVLHDHSLESQLFIDSVQDYAIVMLDRNGYVTSWSPGAEKIVGYEAHEIIGRHFSAFYPPTETVSGKPAQILEQAAETGQSEDDGWRLRKDGSFFWANVVVTALRDATGKLTGFGQVTRDMTRRKWGDEEKFAQIFRCAPAALSITTESEGRFVEVNPEFCRMSGYTRDETIGRTVEDMELAWPENPATGESAIVQATRGRCGGASSEGNLRHKTGDKRTALISCEHLELGGQTCVLTAYRDITERRRMEEELRFVNSRLKEWVEELERRTVEISLMGQMADMLQSCINASEAYEVVAQSSAQMFRRSSGTLYMRQGQGNMMEAVSKWGPDADGSASSFEAAQCWSLRLGRLHSVGFGEPGLQCQHVSHGAAQRWLCIPLMANGHALGVYHVRFPQSKPSIHELGNDQHGAQHGVRQLAQTVSEHIALALGNLQLREKLRQQATRDPLTGLFNRRYMEESLERELRRAERNHRSVGIIMADIDYFKNFNDTYGHDAGDILLKEVAQRLQRNSRKDDIACRFGGEEFLLILPEASLEAARNRAEHLREEVRHATLGLDGKARSVTLSLGVSAFPDHGNHAAALLNAADTALYEAKRSGRDRVRVSEPANRS